MVNAKFQFIGIPIRQKILIVLPEVEKAGINTFGNVIVPVANVAPEEIPP